jgi:hypothetical protein
MSQRNVFVLLGALVVLALLVTFGQRNRSSSSVTSGAEFVPGLRAAINDVERVIVTKSNGETVATLERRPDGWVVVDKSAYRADIAKLRQALSALGDAKILEAKTATPELYSKLGVEDVAGTDATGLQIAVTATGKELPAVILGNVEGSKYRYARRAGEAQSYLIDRNPDVPRTTALWLDNDIVDVRSDRVREVTITHADGEVVTISKATKEAANFDVASVPAGRELTYPGVANVVGNALRELNLEDVEAATSPIEGKPDVAEFRTFDGLVIRAEGIQRGDEHWVTFSASMDTSAAATPAAPADGVAPAAADPGAEAQRINARVGGWRYKIATFQYDQMTRRMADLLKPKD